MKTKCQATQHSLKKLRKEGWVPWVVEKTIPKMFIKQDAWGFVDIIALKGDESLYIQTTSLGNMEKRIQKIMGHPNLPVVHSATRSVIVHGWFKKDNRWQCREEVVTP